MQEVLWCDYAYPGGDLTGYAGVVRYLNKRNGTRSAYDLTRTEVDTHHAAGRPVAAFWQDGASSAGLGYDRGVSDAKRADAEADLLGAAGSWPVHFAVDDGGLDGPTVAPYFRGVLATLRRPVGGYGSKAVCEYLATVLGVQWLIQTSSWSWVTNPDGTKTLQVSPYAWLLQRDHNVVSGTSKIDVDPLLRDLPGAAWHPLGGLGMAAPLTTDQLLAALRKWRVPLVEYGPWRDRCRCHTGSHEKGVGPRKQWGPNIGTTVHITAGDLGGTVAQYIDNILINDPAVPLKCQFAVHDGTAYLLSAGLCNHTLFMSRSAYDALVNGTFSLTSYEDRRGDTYGRTGTLAASTFLYGIENISSAPLSAHPDDYRTSQLICAAIADAQGWTGVDEAGHGEMAIDRSYSDPGINMGLFRAGVRDMVTAGPNPQPPPPQEDDMPLTTTDISKIHDDLVAVLRTKGDSSLGDFIRGAVADVVSHSIPSDLGAKLDALTAKVDALAPKPAGTLAPSEAFRGGLLEYRPEAPHEADESDVYDEDDTSPGTPGVVDQPQT